MDTLALCPSCGCRYRVQAEFEDRRISCKQCGADFQLALNNSGSPKDGGAAAPAVGEITRDDSFLLIGKLAVKYRFATVEQIEQAIALKNRKQRDDQKLFLGDILVEQGILSKSQLAFLRSVQELLAARELDHRFGKIAVKNDFASEEDIQRALEEQKRLFKKTASVKLIGDILVESGVVTAEQRDAVLILQKRLGKGRVDLSKKSQGRPAAGKVENKAEFELSVSDDRRCAYIRPAEQMTGSSSVDTIKKYLKENGIEYGIKGDARIRDFLNNAAHRKESWKIAEGDIAQPGRDAAIKYYFCTDLLKERSRGQNATIACSDRGSVTDVKKGDLLAEKIPASEGKPGKDVYGRPIPAPKPNDVKFRRGAGTMISDDGLKVLATTDGVPGISVMGRVHVLTRLEVSGDVGPKTGHVEFKGEVHVGGSIRDGYRVKGERLTAEEILKAEIEMNGDVAVSGGIIGASVDSGGNVRATYVREADIKAFGDVIVEKGIRDSHIETSGACLIKKGKILSSTITAQKGIWANQIGSEVSRACRLKVGVDDRAKNDVEKIMDFLPFKKKEQEKFINHKLKLERKSKEIENKVGELAQMQDRAMVAQRTAQREAEQLKKANDKVQLATTKAVLNEMDTEIKTMEKNMEKLFDLQDQISEKIADVDRNIEVSKLELQELEDRITEITQWSSSENGVPEVRVNDVICSDTTIDGAHASLTLSQSHKSVLIQEHKMPRSNKTSEWEIRISGL